MGIKLSQTLSQGEGSGVHCCRKRMGGVRLLTNCNWATYATDF